MKFWVQKHNGKLWPHNIEDQIKVNKLPLDPVLMRYTQVRNPKLHRKYFAFINKVYHNLPEKFDDNWPTQRSFRKEMEMHAGHYEMTVNLKGERSMQPKSISYEDLDEMAFQDLYTGVKNVIGRHIMPYVEDVEQELANFY